MLNHSNQLDYVNKPVSNKLLLGWYGIKAPKNITSFSTGKYWLSHWENQLYLNTNKTILLTYNGEVIEIMDSNNGITPGIKKIGVDTSGRLIVNSAHGFYRVNESPLT